MAFAKGRTLNETVPSVKYIGVGVVGVTGVNPDAKELGSLLGFDPQEEPSYTGETTLPDGSKKRYSRAEFVLRTVPDSSNGIDMATRMGLFLRDQYRYNRDQTKIQVIDRFGNTAWVTKDELQTHAIPVYKNGRPARLHPDYRPCYFGEENLTEFLKAYLGIPSAYYLSNSQWVLSDNADDCVARLEHIKDAFTGDFSEIRNLWRSFPDGRVRVLFGVRTAQDGRQYQAVYDRVFLRVNNSRLDRFESQLKSDKESGRAPNCEYRVCPLQEYIIDGTDLSMSVPQGDNPFGDPADNPYFD